MTEQNFFRMPVYNIDINQRDAAYHLAELKITSDMQIVLDYFMYFLFVDTSRLGNNEFSIRHQQIKDGILAIMNGRYDNGSQLISSCIEGMVKESLQNDECIDNSLPYPNWTGTFHTHQKPRNFFQLLEGALQDPRSRIGRTSKYLSEEEIYYVSEMIRNPLAHGARTKAILQDYIGLYHILILLYHDIVNPHNYSENDKYRSWIYYTMRNMRLAGKNPTLDEVLTVAQAENLDVTIVRDNYGSVS